MLAGSSGLYHPRQPEEKAGRCPCLSADALVAAHATSSCVRHLHTSVGKLTAEEGRGEVPTKKQAAMQGGTARPPAQSLWGARACLRGQRADAPVAGARVFLGVHLEAQLRGAPRAPHARQLLLRLAAQHQQPRAARLQAAVQVCAGQRELSPACCRPGSWALGVSQKVTARKQHADANLTNDCSGIPTAGLCATSSCTTPG